MIAKHGEREHISFDALSEASSRAKQTAEELSRQLAREQGTVYGSSDVQTIFASTVALLCATAAKLELDPWKVVEVESYRALENAAIDATIWEEGARLQMMPTTAVDIAHDLARQIRTLYKSVRDVREVNNVR